MGLPLLFLFLFHLYGPICLHFPMSIFLLYKLNLLLIFKCYCMRKTAPSSVFVFMSLSSLFCCVASFRLSVLSSQFAALLFLCLSPSILQSVGNSNHQKVSAV